MNTRLNHLRDELIAWHDAVEKEIEETEKRLNDLKHKAQLLSTAAGIIDKVTFKPTDKKPMV